jgi:phenylacetate-CoA ligase
MAMAQWLPRFQKAYRALRVLEGREAWSRSELDQYQLERVNRLWQHARAHVPYYQRLAAAERLPERFVSLEEFQALVPVLPRQALRERPRDFLSARAECGHWTKTGGSTGTPMDTYWGDDAHREMLLGRYRLLASWGLDIFDRCAMLWGHSAALMPGLAGRLACWRQRVEDWLRNRMRLCAYRLGRDDLRRYLGRIASFRPASLYGYSQAVGLLAAEAQAVGFSCDSLKLTVLTAEPAFDHLIATIERAFRAPAVVEYGSSECGFLAGEGPDRKLRVREDHTLIESRPRSDGRYDLILTVLTNPSFPLIRYDIGDVTDAPIERGPRGMAVLKNVSGRNNDLVFSRTGQPVHSARFEALFKYQADGVRRYRVRQNRDGSLTAEVELTGRAAAAQVPGLERKLRELMEGYPASVQVVDHLPVTPAGKHRLVVSDLAAAV